MKFQILFLRNPLEPSEHTHTHVFLSFFRSFCFGARKNNTKTKAQNERQAACFPIFNYNSIMEFNRTERSESIPPNTRTHYSVERLRWKQYRIEARWAHRMNTRQCTTIYNLITINCRYLLTDRLSEANGQNNELKKKKYRFVSLGFTTFELVPTNVNAQLSGRWTQV